MKPELKVTGNKYGLDPKQADQITKGLTTILEERELLTEAYKDVMLLEITEDTIPTFKDLRLQIRDNRTKGIDKWKKTNKAYFLAGGNFVQAIYNKEVVENERMESQLLSAEKHFENIEKKRLEDLQFTRINLLSPYLENAHEIVLHHMDEDVFEAYLSTKKKAHLDLIQAELDAEKERQAVIKAEKVEAKRVEEENKKLLAEANKRAELAEIEADKAESARKELAKIAELKEVERQKESDRLIKIETDKANKLAKELKERKEAEEKELINIEQNKQDELNKGDQAKVSDLISDLRYLKTKYTFKSVKNKKMYAATCTLIDKVINFIS